jgi:ketosteroid isomerase-like protein
MAATSPAEVNETLAKALSAGDIETIMSLYDDRTVFIPPGAPIGAGVRGLGALRDTISQFIAMKPTLKLTANKTIESDDVALVTGDWTLTGTGPDGEVQMSGTYADIMRRLPDGSWIYAIDNPDGVA